VSPGRFERWNIHARSDDREHQSEAAKLAWQQYIADRVSILGLKLSD
jgi:hypothetical protein